MGDRASIAETQTQVPSVKDIGSGTFPPRQDALCGCHARVAILMISGDPSVQYEDTLLSKRRQVGCRAKLTDSASSNLVAQSVKCVR